MAILSKNKIVEYSRDEKIRLLGIDYIDSNFKDCSYDLRIGTIFKNDEVISNTRGYDNTKIVQILPSEIVTFLTLEIVQIPEFLCATVFPINGKSSKGLLILNPGHIDPGFKGPLSICAINLSKETIPVNLEEEIFTIFFETLNEPTEKYLGNKYIDGKRIEFENDFHKNKASKLSQSFFDLITIKDFLPNLRKQIDDVIDSKIKAYISRGFNYILKFVPAFALLFTGTSAIVACTLLIRSCNNYELENQLKVQIDSNMILRDSTRILNDSLSEYNKFYENLKNKKNDSSKSR